MVFRGVSLKFSTKDEVQYEAIGQFWDYLSTLYPRESLRGLGFNWTANQIEYVIGRRDNAPVKPEEIRKRYPGAVVKEILLPEKGWQVCNGSTDRLSELYEEIYKEGALTYEIETFCEDGSCQVAVCREWPELEIIRETELEDIVRLYKGALGTPGCVWNEYYPAEDILLEDIRQEELFGIRDEQGRVIAAIAKDRDEEVDHLPFWNPDLQPAAELSRLVVSENYRNQGLARGMIRQTMKILSDRGFRAVHYLVATVNEQALKSYSALDFDLAGETELFGHQYLCYEKGLL